ncbi:UV DNA damage repair endonuclease UvsE [Mollicutes bacterium LVI A0039]|nr:UV DNA damage repair endonuclease UvsE [Mollicutes bacterium LVI A0039]
MKIGYACKTLGINAIPGYRTCTTKTYNEALIYEIIEHNLRVLQDTLKYNLENDILMFRISSDIIPLASHPINNFNWQDVFKQQLTAIGTFVKSHRMRVSMHPGQYTIINSPNSDVVERAILDLEYHCNFLDSLGLERTHKLILHIGGVYNDKDAAMSRFITNYDKLPDCVKSRLIIENDDRLFTIADVLNISKQRNIPVVFDNLHHHINPSSTHSEHEWIIQSVKTWRREDGAPKLHYSNQNPHKRIGAHSEYIYIDEFMRFYEQVKDLNVDIMLEVKDKNLSAIKCIQCTNNYSINTYLVEWAKYKYVILERNHNVYLQIREYLKDNANFNSKQFYLLIESGLKGVPNHGSYRNGFDHVWSYFRKVATDKEKQAYKNKLAAFHNGKLKASSIKKYLYTLAIKYERDYLLDSYYFDM